MNSMTKYIKLIVPIFMFFCDVYWYDTNIGVEVKAAEINDTFLGLHDFLNITNNENARKGHLEMEHNPNDIKDGQGDNLAEEDYSSEDDFIGFQRILEDAHPFALSQEDTYTRRRIKLSNKRKKSLRNNDTVDETSSAEIENNYLRPFIISEQLLNISLLYHGETNSSIEIIGRTAEYNNIVLLKISLSDNKTAKFRTKDEKKFIDEIPEKKIIFIVHGLSVMGFHRLECLSFKTQFMTLLEYYMDYLELFDIFLVPMANPDGVALKEEQWNKNISPQSACSGVALDRNFDVAWTGKLKSSCSQQYPGPYPFSEPETRAIRDVLHRYGHRIVAYIHVHAGTYTPDSFKGDAVLYPKGYTQEQSDDDRYINLKAEIEDEMRNTSFRVYSIQVDTLYNWYGKVSGTSVDYASSVYGIPYALEFVMQLYNDAESEYISNTESYIVLSEVWQRTISTVLQHIHTVLN